jgi:hypothetical protein
LGGLVVLFLASTFTGIAKSVVRPRVDVALEERAIIWTDWSGGLFHYYLDRYAAHIAGVGATPAVQSMMLRAVAQDHREQYFVLDGDSMRSVIDRARDLGQIMPVGRAFGYEVLKLDTRAGR